MIEEYCEMDDPLVQSELRRIDAMLCGDDFLNGLGVNAKNAPSSAGFPVVTDVVRARELMVPGRLDDFPDPKPYQEFYAVIGDEAERMEAQSGSSESRRVDLGYSTFAFSLELIRLVFKHAALAIDQHQARDNFLRAGGGRQFGDKNFTWFTDEFVPNYISSLVYHVIQAVYLVGLDGSRINMRVLEAFETGGMPCGWLGPLPEDGGDPVDAIAVLHFGQQAQA